MNSNKKRILIATDIYFLHLMRGNSNRIKSYWKTLKKYYDVDVLFLTEKPKDRDIKNNTYFYSDFLPNEHKPVFIEQPYNISSKVKYEYKLAFDNFIENKQEEYNFIIIPYIWNSYLIDTKPKTNAKFIIDTHDSFSQRTKSLKENGYKFTSACSEEEEKFCLRNFDYIMAISDEEKLVFESMGYKEVFTSKYFYQPEKNKIKLGFIGGNSVHNIDAILSFYIKIFKNNLDKDYFLYICGDVAKNEDVQKLKGETGVVIYEYIWNIEDFYNMVDICINPIRFGSGLKIKNIEAISFQKPVITTTIGLQGMSEEYNNGIISLANNKSDWIFALNELKDKDVLKTLMEQLFYNHINNTEEKVYKELIDILESQ